MSAQDARKAQEYTDSRLLKLENEVGKLNKTVDQWSPIFESIRGDLKKLREDFASGLAETQETIVKASKIYIDQRLEGGLTPVNQSAPTPSRGGLGGIFDQLGSKLGPTIDNIISRYANQGNLPFLGQQPSGVQSEIVDLDRQLKQVSTIVYRNSLRKTLGNFYKEMGLPPPENVTVGAAH